MRLTSRRHHHTIPVRNSIAIGRWTFYLRCGKHHGPSKPSSISQHNGTQFSIICSCSGLKRKPQGQARSKTQTTRPSKEQDCLSHAYIRAGDCAIWTTKPGPTNTSPADAVATSFEEGVRTICGAFLHTASKPFIARLTHTRAVDAGSVGPRTSTAADF